MFAHRGFAASGSGVVENTLPAFEAALALGARYLETDVHASRDGVAIISHDPSLARLTGTDATVSSLSYDELRDIPLGAGAFVSLADVLAALPEARLNIDLKSADAVAPAVAAIRDAGAADRVLVTSFSDARRRAAVRALPGVATSASAGSFATALLASRGRLTPVVRRALAGVVAVQVPERALGMSVPNPRFLRLLHDLGVEMHVWTVNDAAAMHRLLDAGVDGIITDRTDIAVEVLASRS
ncbi:glycerophosphodiester phosphodiesterase family protein [Galbitalea sp. SE-J8]|uniref:glycerophosphodiester phosphodiesterase family protein n=1 Tax=Galbitalea sp. SE-J8 TaxID=3054952 RepID=UPI00259C89AA|nr:glycerophosphodiester phosphodiesterase family protein [Galbitalea sp. SE-J8]MDM4764008.1 glycerophosphodiester phosphodiesterase family protein [Galbitalea sp. SE-J8]